MSWNLLTNILILQSRRDLNLTITSWYFSIDNFGSWINRHGMAWHVRQEENIESNLSFMSSTEHCESNLCQTERRSWWEWQHLLPSSLYRILRVKVSKCQTERRFRFRGEMSACQRKFFSVASNLLLMCWSMKKFIQPTFMIGSSKAEFSSVSLNNRLQTSRESRKFFVNYRSNN